ncbi:MAG TPA: SprT family zinc-dependent metalloprotease [Paracoccaceae bacterium]|nr:SprT family zinc-dependent metalloprotease [Paracoccaceae bacterium]
MAANLIVLDPPVTVALRRSPRARRFTLRVSSRDGSVHLTLPCRTAMAEARQFLERQEGWLRERLASAPQPVEVGLGAVLPLEGRPVRLVSGQGRVPAVSGDVLSLPGPAERAGVRAAAFLKALARDRFTAAADRHAVHLRRCPGRITLRDTGSRWGSCTYRGDLMFSWRLVMAPPEVLDYVAAHEAAHLVEMNHSDRFWAIVARLSPDHARHRAWLRAHGADLHRYRFG